MASAPPAVQTGHCQSCHSSWTHSQAALGEGAGAKTPGHGQQRPTRLHTQHGSQWGREGRLLGAALHAAPPGLRCSARIPTPGPFKALGTLKMSRRGEDLLPRPAVHLRAGADLC